MAVSLHCLLPATWVPPLETPSAAPEEVAAAAAAAATTTSSRSKYAVDDPRRVLISAATSDRPFVDGRGQALLDAAAASDASSSDFDAIDDRTAPR